jgi:ATP-binding cassette, subfamily B, bacterial MsbA
MTNLQIIKRLFKTYTKSYVNKILISVFFSLLVAGSTSSIAWLLDPAIEKIFIEKNQSLILIIPGLVILAFATKGISMYLAKVIMIKVAHDVQKNIQSDLVNSLVAADTKLIDKKHSGKFISNLTFDVGLITNLVSTGLLNVTKDTLTLIGLLTVMFYQNWKLSLVAMIMIPLAGFFAKNLGKRMGKVTTELQEKAGNLTTYLLELFKNHKLIKIFQQENYEGERSDKFLNEIKEKSEKTQIVLVRASPIMETLTGIMIACLIFYSGKLIINNELGINNFFSFLAAMMLAYQPVRSLATLNIAVSQSLSASKRVLPIIDHKNEIFEKNSDQELKIVQGDINFKNVDFRYDTKKDSALNLINLKIKGGKMTALVGYSGAGKSTILNLIPRYYDCNSGDILIDKQSIYKSKLSSLRKNISLVTQDVTLFDDTIKNNIAYADLNASEDEIKKVAKLSFADDFIQKLPDKYDTLIGENGLRLSGGEKQRISIARAMLKKSKIILLDEATSSLDAETENKIQKALSILIKDRTAVVIAHRLSTILNSDSIYVINNGEVMENGTHSELLSNSEIYKNFYKKQIRKN